MNRIEALVLLQFTFLSIVANGAYALLADPTPTPIPTPKAIWQHTSVQSDPASDTDELPEGTSYKVHWGNNATNDPGANYIICTSVTPEVTKPLQAPA